MKIHAIVGLGKSHIKTRDVSCYCEVCLTGQTCTSWNADRTRAREENDRNVAGSANPECSNVVNVEKELFHVGDFIAAIYEGHWYIGAIIDTDDEEYEVRFMEARKQFFQWLRKDDVLWINHEKILTKIKAPEATGKTERMFKLLDSDKENILKLYKEFSHDQN